MPGHTVRSEETGWLIDHSGQHADNLITDPGVAPIAVEAEFMPAASVEADAAARLGLRVQNEPHPIEAAVALRYPAELAEADNLNVALLAARLSYALLYRDGIRFPEAGWLEGSVGISQTSCGWPRYHSRPSIAPPIPCNRASSTLLPCSTRSQNNGLLLPAPSQGCLACMTWNRPAAWRAPSSPTPWSSTSGSPVCTRA